MKYLGIIFSILFIISAIPISAQDIQKDKGVFEVSNNPFFDKVLASIDSIKTKDNDPKKVFKMDFTDYDLPHPESEFTRYWHNEPVSQANTNTCWSFSTTSYFESEIFRIHNKKVKLSEMWTAYWEFVEKARGFVQSRGEWSFTDGSESNAVSRIWSKYGIVPSEAYTGLLPGEEYLNTEEMFDEMREYLNFVKKNKIWNEEVVVGTIRTIMDHWIGKPPATFEYQGQTISPQQYLKDYLQLNLNDYIEILSLMQEPYYEFVEYKVPDNWWHNKDYFNVPLDEFMKTIKRALRNGYTLCIGGDVSESGKNAELDVFVVPSYDIPSQYIDESARQLRFSNGTTTDDHGVHLVGYLEREDSDWYLVKDSGSSSRNGKLFGYFIFSEDYVKLKMLGFTVHKDVVKELLVKSGK